MTNGNDLIMTPMGTVNARGLTKREHFAAMAMQGLLSVPTMATDADAYLKQGAKLSVIAADALIKALNDKQ